MEALVEMIATSRSLKMVLKGSRENVNPVGYGNRAKRHAGWPRLTSDCDARRCIVYYASLAACIFFCQGVTMQFVVP